DGLAGQVHEGLRFDEQHFLAAETAFGDLGLEFPGPRRKGMAAGNRGRRHEAYIVPVAGIFRAWIAETCKKQHRNAPRAARLTSLPPLPLPPEPSPLRPPRWRPTSSRTNRRRWRW